MRRFLLPLSFFIWNLQCNWKEKGEKVLKSHLHNEFYWILFSHSISHFDSVIFDIFLPDLRWWICAAKTKKNFFSFSVNHFKYYKRNLINTGMYTMINFFNFSQNRNRAEQRKKINKHQIYCKNLIFLSHFMSEWKKIVFSRWLYTHNDKLCLFINFFQIKIKRKFR